MAARFGDSDYREERILQAKPPEDELDLITKEVCDKWKSLLVQLGVPSGKIKSFLHDNNNVSSSACFDGLVYWREGNKPCKPATWSVLLDAIEKGAELKGYAQERRDKLFSKKDHVDEEVRKLRKALEEKEEEIKKLRQKSQGQPSSTSSLCFPSFFDQLSPYIDNSQGLDGLELSPALRERSARKYSEKILKSCKRIKVGPPAVYKLKTKPVVEYDKIAAYRVDTGSLDFGPDSLHKVLMIVGATGCGKSTIINALANYTLGVSFTDEYRYQLISPSDEGGQSQAFSQTSRVTAYTFPRRLGSRVPYTLTIVDTPGYGDTRGIDRDRDITQQIKKFFNTKDIGVDHLNAVAFVVKAGDQRLTPAQKYIFTTMLDIFGKNIGNCIMIVATHADQKEIAAMDALKMAKVPLNQQLMFTVNNVALYKQNKQLENEEDDWVGQHRKTWGRNAKVYQTMYCMLADMDDTSLWQTTENLKERDNLRVTLESIGPRIKEGITKENEIKAVAGEVVKNKEEMDRNKDFKITATVTVAKVKYVPLTSGQAFNCTKCETTCHYPCIALINRTCAVISFFKNKCTVCKGECPAESHKREKSMYQIEYVQERQSFTEEQLEKRFKYCSAEKEMSKSETLLEGMKKEHQNILLANVALVRKAQRCLERIRKISLNPNPSTEEGYIDMMIEIETQEQEPGWEDRVKALYTLKKNVKLLSTVKSLEDCSDEEVLKELKLDYSLLN